MMRHEEARMEYGLSQTWKRRKDDPNCDDGGYR